MWPDLGRKLVRVRAPAGCLIRGETLSLPSEGPIPSKSIGPSFFAYSQGGARTLVHALAPSLQEIRHAAENMREKPYSRASKSGRGVSGSTIAPFAPVLQLTPVAWQQDGR